MAVSGPASARGFTLFPTEIGQCAIAWSDDSIVATQLPERTIAATRRRIGQFTNDTANDNHEIPTVALDAIQRIQRVTSGANDDLRSVPIDRTDVSNFTERVREIVRAIPLGTTMTYGDVAGHAGCPDGARAVGAAMRSNRLAIIVPCHRVVAASGRIGGFSAPDGAELKLRLLHIERLASDTTPPRFDTQAAADHLSAADPELADVIAAVGPPGLRARTTTTTLFADLVETIVHQQLSSSVGAILYARLSNAMPQPLDGPTPSGLLRLADGDLAAIGLRAAKIEALRSLTDAAYNGQLPSDHELDHLGDDAVLSALTSISGIGRWNAATILILRLCRPDVFCDGDEGLANALTGTHAGSLAQRDTTYETISERWRPYRSLACWYLWKSLQLPAT